MAKFMNYDGNSGGELRRMMTYLTRTARLRVSTQGQSEFEVGVESKGPQRKPRHPTQMLIR